MATVTEKVARPKIRQTRVLHRRQVGAGGERQDVRDDPPGHRRSDLPRWPRATRPTSTRRWRRPARRSTTAPWRTMDARDRGALMYKLADLIEEEADELAALETLDNGKPIRDSRAADMPLVIDCLPLLRRLGRQDSGQDDPDPRRLLLLHAARAGRRGRADHSVELPAADGRRGSGARRWRPAARS